MTQNKVFLKIFVNILCSTRLTLIIRALLCLCCHFSIYLQILKVKESENVSCKVMSDSLQHQAPLSMEFSRQEYWSGLPFSSEDLPDPGKILKSGQILWPFSALILQMAKMWHGRIKGFVFNINNDYITNIIQWELNITLLITGLQFFSCQHSHINTYKHAHTLQTSTSDLLTMPKPLAVWVTTNCGKFLKRWEYQTTLPAS